MYTINKRETIDKSSAIRFETKNSKNCLSLSIKIVGVKPHTKTNKKNLYFDPVINPETPDSAYIETSQSYRWIITSSKRLTVRWVMVSFIIFSSTYKKNKE